MTATTPLSNALRQDLSLLNGLKRGIEREALRVSPNGFLASTDHPTALGSALCHDAITTDYAEALLELITQPQHSVEALLDELNATHRFVAQNLGQEVLWCQSMPAHLPPEKDIRIAWYGPSNAGMVKHVYRRGLAERYGKRMQCIAGVHYNFSLPDALWGLLDAPGDTLQEQRTQGYLALIRNFTRYSWLLMYLFGASPLVSKDFLGGHSVALEQLAPDSYGLPWATSLRMSDLGYQNKEAQAELQLCYNDLDTLLLRMRHAATTDWPAYAQIGTHRDGEWIQLNNHILQIENEYYSNIRPKRTTLPGERPLTALEKRGVEYIEVRCLDIDPNHPLGISPQSCYFLDTFLLFCAVEASPCFPDNGFCQASKRNFAKVINEGRKPGLMLERPAKTDISLADWANELLDRMQPYAELLDEHDGFSAHQQALDAQRIKVNDPQQTPSALWLQAVQASGLSLTDYTLQHSQALTQALQNQPINPSRQALFEAESLRSLQAQAQIEAQDTESFDAFMQRFNSQL